jgi:hypothetical protein
MSRPASTVQVRVGYQVRIKVRVQVVVLLDARLDERCHDTLVTMRYDTRSTVRHDTRLEQWYGYGTVRYCTTLVRPIPSRPSSRQVGTSKGSLYSECILFEKRDFVRSRSHTSRPVLSYRREIHLKISLAYLLGHIRYTSNNII